MLNLAVLKPLRELRVAKCSSSPNRGFKNDCFRGIFLRLFFMGFFSFDRVYRSGALFGDVGIAFAQFVLDEKFHFEFCVSSIIKAHCMFFSDFSAHLIIV